MDLQENSCGKENSAISKVAEIGLRETVNALTALTGTTFRMSGSCSTTSSLEKLFSGEVGESVSAGIYMAVEGDVQGHIGSLCSWSSACVMWNTLLGAAPSSPDEITELEASMLLEVGNIMNAAFLRAVVDQFDVHLLATPPAVGVDMTSAILSTIVSNAADSEQQAISIRNSIRTEDGEAEWLFLFIADARELRRLFGQSGLSEVA